MKKFIIFVPNVADGLAIGITSQMGLTIQIDCGSHHQPNLALENGLLKIMPDIFILSHFHVDHYNGLFRNRIYKDLPLQYIRRVYYPRIPEFSDRRRFLTRLFVVNARVMGASTGSQEADFLKTIAKINKVSFNHRAVSQGDIIKFRGVNFSVLWPPKILEDQATIRSVSNAISAFDEAIDQDEITRDIYNYIEERRIIDPYLIEDTESIEKLHNHEDNSDWILQERHPIPAVVNKANRLLRSAANRLSLAFKETNELLFLGDLESREINSVVNNLIDENQRRYRLLITPHHGTHWHDSLYKIRADISISSVGNKLISKYKTNHQVIADHCLATHINGDINLPLGLDTDIVFFNRLRREFPYYFYRS